MKEKMDTKENLDIRTTLELDYYPSPKERSRKVYAEGKMIDITLPASAFNNMEMVVKRGGKTDPMTGQTGDAYVLVKFKHNCFRPNSLGNILKNIGMVLYYVLGMVYSTVKYVVTLVFSLVFSKAGIVLILLGIIAFVIWRFFLK